MFKSYETHENFMSLRLATAKSILVSGASMPGSPMKELVLSMFCNFQLLTKDTWVCMDLIAVLALVVFLFSGFFD